MTINLAGPISDQKEKNCYLGVKGLACTWGEGGWTKSCCCKPGVRQDLFVEFEPGWAHFQPKRKELLLGHPGPGLDLGQKQTCEPWPGPRLGQPWFCFLRNRTPDRAPDRAPGLGSGSGLDSGSGTIWAWARILSPAAWLGSPAQ